MTGVNGYHSTTHSSSGGAVEPYFSLRISFTYKRRARGHSHFNMAEIEEMMHGFSRADSVTGMKLKKQLKWWMINMYHSQLS